MNRRILIFGASGTGKNWLGERLSEKSGIRFYDTDDIAWEKRFTVERKWGEKLRMLKDVAKKKSWVIGTGATTYVDEAVKRSDLIIILKGGFLCTTYRIVKRHIKNSISGKEKSLYNPFRLAYLNYLDHRHGGKYDIYFEKLKLKYPKKVRVFSQREKREFLRNFSG